MLPVQLEEVIATCPGARVLMKGQAPSSLAISGVSHDSRVVQDGDLFACIGGKEHDGHEHALEAAKAGAAALLVDRELPVPTPQVVVNNVRSALGAVSACVYGYPSTVMKVLGVTGTAGKTTVAHALAQALRGCGDEAEVIGTLEGPHTTPEAPDLQKALAEMRDRGRRWACLEVSSHGLDYGRVEGTEFAAKLFTNLSPEHLDFHGDMENYFRAKRRLFERDAGVSVISVADEWGSRLAQELQVKDPASLVTVDPTEIHNTHLTASGSSFTWRERPIRSQLLGQFNVVNLQLVAETLRALDIDSDLIADALQKVAPIRGRMQPVASQGSDISVVVDYSHKPEALRQALNVSRTFTNQRVWVVFGAGGDRDKSKRPIMGRIASDLADEVIVTSDNPRSEDPAEIAREIVAGAHGGRVTPRVILDRADAIEQAIMEATPGDLVLVAGKGHEAFQVVGIERRPFDDAKISEKALSYRDGTQ